MDSSQEGPELQAAFESELSRLDWLAYQLTVRFDRLELEVSGADDVDFARASLALLRKALVWSRGVNLLLHEGHVEQAAPLERALYEVTLEIRYLLNQSDRGASSRKIMVSGWLDVLRYACKNRHFFGPEAARTAISELRHLRDLDPGVYEEVAGRGNRHWSGHSRTYLEESVAGKGIPHYKWLSRSRRHVPRGDACPSGKRRSALPAPHKRARRHGFVLRDPSFDQMMEEEIPYSPRMRIREEAICALEEGDFQKTAIYWDHYSTTDENICRWEWDRARKRARKSSGNRR